VITASAGNHAQGVAMAASHLGIKATIVMPTTTPSLKVEGVPRGGHVVLHGESFPMHWPMRWPWPTRTAPPSCRRSTTRT
jgi:threonine dehydratase